MTNPCTARIARMDPNPRILFATQLTPELPRSSLNSIVLSLLLFICLQLDKVAAWQSWTNDQIYFVLLRCKR